MKNNDDAAESFLTESEMRIFKKLTKKLLVNRSDRYLKFRGTPWNSDTDCVVYIDDQGCDTAYDHGADIVLKENLSKAEIKKMEQEGYIIKGDKVFAFSRFLMEKFITASLVIKAAEIKHDEVYGYLRGLMDEINQIADGQENRRSDRQTVDGEIVRDKLPGAPS